MAMEIRSFELPPIGTQCHVALNPATRQLAVFDAPLNAWPTVERLAVKTGYAISGLYLTHGHWDHTLDGWRFNAAGVPVFAHAGDRPLLEDPGCMASYSIPGLEMRPVAVTAWVEDGQRLEVAGRPAEARHVPGHSPGSLLYWFCDDNLAVSGDALFNGSIGRTDFPFCSFEQLAAAIRGRIYTLPDPTVLYPGHGPSTTVGREALHNPFVTR